MSVIAASVALGCSPVSAATALMETLTDRAPYGFGPAHILMVTVPAAIVGLVVSSLVVGRLGRDLDEDPEIAARVADGTLPAPGDATVLTADLALRSPCRTRLPGRSCRSSCAAWSRRSDR
jgi:anaerobic C4-dicarboxylate transporter DcuA/anaerobic C4-dicarboxylate transporter DcuB